MITLDAGSFELLDEIDSGLIILDSRQVVRHWNGWVQACSGIASDEAVGRTLWDCVPPLEKSQLRTAVEDALVSGAPGVLSHTLHPLLFPLRCHDGRAMRHDVIVRPLGQRSAPHCLIQIKDATERRHAHESLVRSRARFRAFFDHAALGICELDFSGRILAVNDRLCAITGHSREELTGVRLHDILLPEDREHCAAQVRSLHSGEVRRFGVENRCARRDGALMHISITCSAIPGPDDRATCSVALIEDISRRKEVEAERERLVEQANLLAREGHHRVKNSLAVVASLLSLQSHAVTDPTARRHLAEAQQRVMGIARVHERLHQGVGIDAVSLLPFVRDLCTDIEHTLAVSERGSRVVVEIEEHLTIAAERATPLALIISELITNALKHAHPDGAPGRITVRGIGINQNGLRLSVSDDGVGLPPGFDPRGTQGLGMRIVAALSEQIGSGLEVRSDGDGTEFAVRLDLGLIDQSQNMTVATMQIAEK